MLVFFCSHNFNSSAGLHFVIQITLFLDIIFKKVFRIFNFQLFLHRIKQIFYLKLIQGTKKKILLLNYVNHLD